MKYSSKSNSISAVNGQWSVVGGRWSVSPTPSLPHFLTPLLPCSPAPLLSRFVALRFIVAVALVISSALPVTASSKREYTIQTGSTRSEEGARAEVSRLIENGQRSYYVKVDIPGKGIYYRIHTGRFPTQEAARARAEAMRRSNLIDEFLVTGFEGPGNAAFTDDPRSRREDTETRRRGDAGTEPITHHADSKTEDTPQPENLADSSPPPAIKGANPTAHSLTPAAASPAIIIQRPSEPRIKLFPGGTSEMTFDETITAVTVMSPEIVRAEMTGARSVKLTALSQGEAVIIATGDGQRRTFAVDVIAQPGKTVRQIAEEARRRENASRVSGSYTLYFVPPVHGNSTILRQKYEYHQKLSDSRSLRVDGEMFKIYSDGDRGAVLSRELSFGIDRLSLGISAPSGTLDLLDSQLVISPLSFHDYTLRGLHLVSNLDSSLRGLELFGGIARPSPSLFEVREGYLGGARMPVARGASWQARAGFFAIATQRETNGEGGGLILQSDIRYAPGSDTDAEGEMAYAEGGLSWRARLDLHRGAFDLSGETLNLDRRSPLISLGAQPGSRQFNSFALQWSPADRFRSSFSYNRARILPRANAGRSALNSSALIAGAGYSISSASRLNFQFVEQKLETNATPSSPAFQIETRSATLNYTARFADRWSNSFEARVISSRESRAAAQMERGFSLRDELQRSWDRWSATGYFAYTRSTPSLASLIISNPALLPPLLRRAFESDPARFLAENRDLLPELLAGVLLPETRNTNMGVRIQGGFSRYMFSGDMRYGASELFAREQRDLAAIFNASVRLDSANSIQVSGSRSFTVTGVGNIFTLAVSYTHRFGAFANGGFQFSDLLGLNRGHIEGIVFFDLNGNGHQDAGESGFAGATVRLDDERAAVSDEQGRFSFAGVSPGTYNVSLVSGELGARLRATTKSEQLISVSAKETVNVDFGVNDFGFVSGRVFNDLFLMGESGAAHSPGVSGARVRLQSIKSGSETLTHTVDASGMYQFNNLTPGSYKLEIDAETLPPDFKLPRQISWTLTVEPMRGNYLNIPLAAQRAVSGIVFIDKDGDGKFDAKNDEPVANARVSAGREEALTHSNGSYLLRNLPAGKMEIKAYLPLKEASRAVTIELGAEPVLLRVINFAIEPK